MRFLLPLFSCLALLGLSACAGEPKPGPHPIKGETLIEPAWALTGEHASYPTSDFYVATSIIDGPRSPDRVRMYDLLSAQVHAELRAALREKLSPRLQSAIDLGRWVSLRLVPQSEVVYESWSSGKRSAALVALSKAALRQHAASLEAPSVPSVSSVNEIEMGALEVFTFRTERFALALDRLAILALSGRLDAENAQQELDLANGAAEFLISFKDEVMASISGGDVRWNLGEKPDAPIALTLRYQSVGAESLPLEPVYDGMNVDGQVIDADAQTNVSGTALMRFDANLRYVGKENVYVGFALAPDKVSPLLLTGLKFPPWRARITLPARTNVTILMELRENTTKIENSQVLVKALEAQIREALPVTSDLAAAERSGNFVLKLTGSITVNRLPKVRGNDQVRASGA
ncbi:MAG: hypothetical protein KDB07_09305, partial [Planctomycetes bacterium]|nr:hypothetical protein [Planctomycetota bacterium]